MSQRLCIVAMAATLDDLRRQRDAAADGDLVELRLDTLPPGELDVAGALQGRRTPVIATCRARWEGGHFAGSEEERRAVLARALDLGAEYVDVEWQAGFQNLLQGPQRERIVLSHHAFEGVPADLDQRARQMQATGTGVIKLAAMAQRLSDTATLLQVARAVHTPGGTEPQQTVVIAMGDCGEVSRVCPSRFGSAWSYAGSVAGIGQLGPRALLDRYRFRSLSANTRLYGIVGRPVGHSASPAMHNAAFGATGVDGVYLSLPAVDVDDFVTFARAFSLSGASVTIPYKVGLMDRVDCVDPLAREVGAINTLRMDDDDWQGTNTDVAGFLRPLTDRGTVLRDMRVAVVGAGGSARAVIVALRSAGARVRVHARRASSAQALADTFTDVAAGPWPVPDGSWDLLVNCTPVGMHPDTGASPVAATDLAGSAGRTVYDLVYNPLETQLRREAGRAGLTTIGGLDMLVEQAREQFLLWTGVRPDASVMREAALARLAEFEAGRES
jgi:3-dehydroquinate dehydratase/shikimate dehydrogenase